MGSIFIQILAGVICLGLGAGTVGLSYWLVKRQGQVTALGVFNWLLPLVIVQMFPALFLMGAGNLHLLMLDFGWVFPLVFYYALCLIYALPFIALAWFLLLIRSFAKKRRMQGNADNPGNTD
jgi:hypothetical protein